MRIIVYIGLLVLMVILLAISIGNTRRLTNELETAGSQFTEMEADWMIRTGNMNQTINDLEISLVKAQTAHKEILEDMELLIALKPIDSFMDPIDKDYMLRHLEKGRVFDSRTRMTSSFGESTGIQNRWRGGHRGLDLVPDGDWHVQMPWDGVSSSIGIDEIYGKYVVVNITDNIRIMYAHLSTIFYTALPTKELKKGDVIGVMGDTGMSTAAHLHFELQVFTGETWMPVDPSPWIERGIPVIGRDNNA